MILAVLAALVFMGVGCDMGGSETAEHSDGYKKIAITADVELNHDSTEATTCVGSAAFAFDFYVDPNNQEGSHLSEGFLQLTDYHCIFVDGKECQTTVLDTSYQPFPVEGKITYGTSSLHIVDDPDSDEAPRGDRDVTPIQFTLSSLPSGISYDVDWYCPGPGSISKAQPDPALAVNFGYALMKDPLVLYPQTGYTDDVLFENIALNMGMTADVYLTYSESIVDAIGQ